MKRHTTSGDTKGDGVRQRDTRAAHGRSHGMRRQPEARAGRLGSPPGGDRRVIMLLLSSGLTTDVKYRASTPDSVAGIRSSRTG